MNKKGLENQDKLIKNLAKIAESHETIHFMYWVTQSIEGRKLDLDNMDEHGSLESYCEKCIARAVESKHKEWVDERNILMGQVYEAEKRGYFIRHGYGNDKKYRFRKIKVSPQHIEQMKRNLTKKYRVGTFFSFGSMQLVGYETEGFESCNGCGKMFETSLLLNDQELEHWESLSDDDYRTLDARTAYELDAIFYEGFSGNHELHDRCLKLAERISSLMVL